MSDEPVGCGRRRRHARARRSRTGSRKQGRAGHAARSRADARRPRERVEPRRVEGEAPIVWDRHYHVTLLSDAHNRGILAELGLDDEMRWVKTRTGYYSDGRLSSVSNTFEFLRLPALNLVDKLRLGATIWYGSRVTDWRNARADRRRDVAAPLSGGRAFRAVLAAAAAREARRRVHRDVGASFIWATIQRLYAARRSGLKEEMFGYVPGGYARVLDAFGDAPARRRRRARAGDAASSSDRVGRRTGRGHARATAAIDEFDDVVVTAAAPLAARLCPGLAPAEYVAAALRPATRASCARRSCCAARSRATTSPTSPTTCRSRR